MSKRGVGRKRRRQERRRVAEMKRRAELIASLQKALDAQMDRTRQAELELMDLKRMCFGSDTACTERICNRIHIDETVFGRIPVMFIRVRPDQPVPQYILGGPYRFGPYRSYRFELVAERGWANWRNLEIVSTTIRKFWEFDANRKREGMQG